MRRILSVLLAILLVVGSVSGGFAASGPFEFNAGDRITLKETGSSTGADISFNGDGSYTARGQINYDFELCVPNPETDLVIELYGETSNGSAYLKIDGTLNGDDLEDFLTTRSSVSLPDGYAKYSKYTIPESQVIQYSSIYFEVKWSDVNNQEVAHINLEACFEPDPPEYVTLTMAVDGDGETEPPVGDHVVTEGTVVDLTATPDPGWHFVEWLGPVASSGSADTEIEMTTDATVTAVFERNVYELLVDHTGEGSTTPDGTSPRDYEDVVPLSADPAYGWHFVEWIGPVADSGDPTTTVEILDNTHVTAVFERTIYFLDISSIGNGSTVPPTGLHPYPFETPVPVDAIPGPSWYFAGWTGPDAGEVTAGTIVMNSDKILIAEFLPREPEMVYLSISVDGSGTTVPPSPGVYPYPIGANVPLEAVPATGWEFVEWLGPVASSGSAVTTIDMYSDQHVTAVFAPREYTLTVTHVGEGMTDPSGAVPVHYGELVELEARADPCWRFIRWDGPVSTPGQASTTVYITGDTEVEAVFHFNEQCLYTVTTDEDPPEGGTTSGGIVDAPLETPFTVEAMPTAGWSFDGWSTDGSTIFTTDNPYDGIVVGNENYTAHFSSPPIVYYTVDTAVEPSGGGTATGGVVDAELGDPFTVTATPASGWYFAGWSTDGSTIFTTENPYDGTVVGNETYTAHFSETPIYYTVDTAVEPSGGGTATGGVVDADLEDPFTVTATPASGWYFVGWSTDGSTVFTDSNPYEGMVTGNETYTAHFTPEYMVTLTIDIDGGGEVETGTYGTVYSEEIITVSPGTMVYMNPDADSGWYFDDWEGPDQSDVFDAGGGSYGIEMDENKEITADFNKRKSPPPPVIRHRLEITVEGSGSVEPFVGSQTYYPGTVVDVEADPASGWTFDGWIGPDGGDVVDGQIEMNDDKSITAKFVQSPTPPPPPPIEPPEIEIPLIEAPLGEGDLPDTGQALPWLTMILGFCVMTFGYFFKKEME